MDEVRIAKTTDDATAAWTAMTAAQQAEVKAKLEEGDDPVRAVNSVLYNRPIEAAARAGTRFVTLGLDDNAAGAGAAAGAAYQRLADAPRGEGFVDSLRAAGSEGRAAHSQAIDERRAATDDLYTTNPKSYGVAAVLGTLATAPVFATKAALGAPHFARALTGGAGAAAKLMGRRALARAKAAAPMGAVSGVGLGDADTVQGVASDALAGAGLSALLGAGAPIAGRAITAAADKVKGAASSALTYGGQNADILRVLTTMGKTGGTLSVPAALQAVAVVPGKAPEAARVLRSTRISKGVTTTEGILDRANDAKKESGELIGEIIEATDAGGGRVNGKAVAAALKQQAYDIQRGSGGAFSSMDEPAQAAVDDLLAAARRYESAGMLTLKNAQTRITGDPKIPATTWLAKLAGFGKRANDLPTNTKSDTAASVTQALRAGMDEAVERTGLTGILPASVASSKLLRGMPSSTPTEAYQSLRRVYQVASLAAKAAQTSVDRGSKNHIVDLTSAALAAASFPLAVAHMVLKVVQSSGRASGAEAMRSMGASLAKVNVGPALRPAIEKLSQAASVSGPALKATFEDLLRTDSAFAEIINEATGTSAEQRRAALVSLSP